MLSGAPTVGAKCPEFVIVRFGWDALGQIGLNRRSDRPRGLKFALRESQTKPIAGPSEASANETGT